MPSLKDYRDRIASVKSTRKITSAMKMVAASKLKKAQDQAVASQPYAEKMASILQRLSANLGKDGSGPKLLTGTGRNDTVLVVVVTSDRGLCGGFNGNLIRLARNHIKGLLAQNKTVKIICVGKKGYDLLKKDYKAAIVNNYSIMEGKRLAYSDADRVCKQILDMFEAGEFDECQILYNRFRSVIAQVPSVQQLIPFRPESTQGVNDNVGKPEDKQVAEALYEFEPDEEKLLISLLPRNLGVQTFRCLLDSAAGEQAARMTAMDNATRNAGDMINRLTLTYNRARQAYITKELIEIISGAEAV